MEKQLLLEKAKSLENSNQSLKTELRDTKLMLIKHQNYSTHQMNES